jgi:hypothetical protein
MRIGRRHRPKEPLPTRIEMLGEVRAAPEPGSGHLGKIAGKGAHPAQALGEHEPEGVDVRRRPDTSAGQLFRGEISGRPDRDWRGRDAGVLDETGDAEVGEEHAAVRRYEDVARLHVAMNHAPPVDVGEATGDTPADGDDLALVEGTLGAPLGERRAVDQVHHEVRAIAVEVRVEQSDEVRVVERRESAHLAAEVAELRVSSAQQLDRHVSLQPYVEGPTDRGHSSGTDDRSQPVAISDHLADDADVAEGAVLPDRLLHASSPGVRCGPKPTPPSCPCSGRAKQVPRRHTAYGREELRHRLD